MVMFFEFSHRAWTRHFHRPSRRTERASIGDSPITVMVPTFSVVNSGLITVHASPRLVDLNTKLPPM